MGSSRLGLAPPPLGLFSTVSARVSQALAISRRASLCPGSPILALISMQSWARRRCLKTSSGSFIPPMSLPPLSRQLAERRSGSARGSSIFIPGGLISVGRQPNGPRCVRLQHRLGPLLIRGKHPVFIGNVVKGFPNAFRHRGIGLTPAFDGALSVHIPV